MRTFLTIMVAVWGAGCGTYFPPDRNIKEQVDESAILGKWLLTPGSVQLLRRDGFRPDGSHGYSVELKADRTCEFASVLDDVEEPRYVVVPCTWVLEHATTGDSNVRKANTLRLELEVAGGVHIRYLNFARDNGVLLLWNYWGDPDLWEFVEYSKSEDSTSHRPLQPTRRHGTPA